MSTTEDCGERFLRRGIIYLAGREIRRERDGARFSVVAREVLKQRAEAEERTMSKVAERILREALLPAKRAR